ncbi:MAG: YbaN family protein [Pirellulales bacterium]|nr:YbaN family protein [Pirellulales bacterium]
MKFLRLFTGPREVAIDVAASGRSLTIELPDFDRRVADGTLRQLVERLFGAPCVEAVLVGLAQRSIVVEFDPRQAGPFTSLEEMTTALRQPTSPIDSWPEAALLNGNARRAAPALATVRSDLGLRTLSLRRLGRGALEVELPSIHNRRPLTRALASDVEQFAGVRKAHGIAPQALLRIAHDEAVVSKGRLLTAVNERLTALLNGPELSNTAPLLATGATRITYLAAGMGCLAMSGLGLVMPGLPTVPFVLATSYFFVRSSPRLDRRLRQSRLFGQMLRDWDEHGGIRPRAKISAIAFSLTLSTVMVLVIQPTLGTFSLIAIGTGIGIALILRIPTVNLPDDSEAPRLSLTNFGQRLRLLLPTPAPAGTV